MYAVIRTGGKQYKVQPGDIIRVEKLENALGSEFDLTEVLMVGGDSPVIGAPVVQNAAVTVVVTKQTRDRKVIIFKKKRRQGYRRFKTHRQHFTELFVKAISLNGKVTNSDQAAKVVDVDAQRVERIHARTEAKNEAKQNRNRDEGTVEKAVRSTAKKKVAKKAAPKKAAKKTGAKKAGGAKKKVAKKTSKKA